MKLKEKWVLCARSPIQFILTVIVELKSLFLDLNKENKEEIDFQYCLCPYRLRLRTLDTDMRPVAPKRRCSSYVSLENL